eukprot:scaffold312_cov145-Skeletonema_menzelii.AAC.8
MHMAVIDTRQAIRTRGFLPFDVRAREISPLLSSTALEGKSQVNYITLKRRNTPASVRKVESNNCVARRPKV